MSIEVTDSSFSELHTSKGVLVLDFWAEWCGPCRTYGPIIEEFADENPDIKVGKVNVDENKTLATEYGIRSIPTTVVFKDGHLVTKVQGIIPKNKLQEITNI